MLNIWFVKVIYATQRRVYHGIGGIKKVLNSHEGKVDRGKVCPLCISYYFLNAVVLVPFAEILRIHLTSLFIFGKTLSQRAASGFHHSGDKLSKPLWQMD